MSEIKDRQDAASDIDPIVAALADDTVNDNRAAAAVEGLGHADDADVAIEASDDVPATEGTVIDEASSAEAHTTDADFELVAAAAADAVADALAAPAEVEEFASDTAVVDITLASEAMPAELAADADISAADDLGPVVLPVVRIPGAAETGPFEHTTAAYADTVVELEAPADEFSADDDGPLLDGELEDGIASVFAALHAAAMDGATPPVVEPLGDIEAADGVTFRLLGELDRLWHRAA